jgi:hypothetical protein
MKFSLAAIVLMGVSASAVDLTADVSISIPVICPVYCFKMISIKDDQKRNDPSKQFDH